MVKKNFVITGITSGFGLEVTESHLKKGHSVVGIARGGEKRLQSTSLEPFLKQRSQFLVIDLDLKNDSMLKTAAEKALDFHQGKVDVLINNAGLGYLRPIFAQENHEIKEQMDVNFIHLIFWTRFFLKSLQLTQGRIIQISSIAGLTTYPFYGAYAASKHALEAASEALYYELSPLGIQISIVEPGGFHTAFSQKAIQNNSHVEQEYKKPIQNLVQFLTNQKSKWTKKPDAVIHLIIRLSFQKNIPLRTRVGFDAHFLYFVKWILPDALRSKIFRLLYKKIFNS